jgi:hypothetical protein
VKAQCFSAPEFADKDAVWERQISILYELLALGILL